MADVRVQRREVGVGNRVVCYSPSGKASDPVPPIVAREFIAGGWTTTPPNAAAPAAVKAEPKAKPAQPSPPARALKRPAVGDKK